MLHFQFFGPPKIFDDQTEIRDFESRKALGLLAYLMCQNVAISRTHLATLFWPDKPEGRGRGNLSRVLNNLSGLLPNCFLADRHTIQFQASQKIWFDLHEYENLIQGDDPADWAKAASLYQGEFLEGLYLDDCAEFEIWLAGERERAHQEGIRVLGLLADHHAARGNYPNALQYARRLLALAPWWEEAHRQVMLFLARGGQHSAALAQYKTCRQILGRELGVEPSRATRTLYERILAARNHPKRHAPPQATPFIGRADELQRALKLLSQPQTRLLTLIGLGGSGKTRLAIQIARHSQFDYLHGVFYLPLAAIPTENQVITTLADEFKIASQGHNTTRTRLLEYLAKRETLLIFDNFEHLLPARNLIAEILAAAPDVKILITSREPLQLRWEQRFNLTGLAPSDAAALFAAIAARLQPEFKLTPANRPLIAEICQNVDHLPLAIELVAAWVREIDLAQINTQITQHPNRIKTAMFDTPKRQRSIRIVLEHTWGRLTPAGQQALMGFAVFRGGFQARASANILKTSPGVLAELQNHSLITAQESGRFSIHELIRQFSLQKCAQNPAQFEQNQAKHCAFYAAELENQYTRIIGNPNAPAHLQEYLSNTEQEFDNLQAAWQWAVEQNNVDASEQMTDGLFRFLEFKSWHHHAQEILEWSVVRLQPRFAAKPAENQLAKTVGALRCYQGRFEYHLSNFEQAKTFLATAENIFRAIDNQRGLGWVWFYSGQVAYHLGNYAAAEEYYSQSLPAFISQGDQMGTAMANEFSGTLQMVQGNHAQAKKYYHAAHAILQKINFEYGLAGISICLGDVAHVQGDHLAARRYFQESLSLFSAYGDLTGQSVTRMHLGNLARSEGDYAEAQAQHQASIDLHLEIGDKGGLAACYANLGIDTYYLDDYPQMLAYCQEGLHIAREVGYRRAEAVCHIYLGHAHRGLGNLAAGSSQLHTGLKMAHELRAKAQILEALVAVGALWVAAHRFQDAALALTIPLGDSNAHPRAKSQAQAWWQKVEGHVGPAKTCPNSKLPELNEVVDQVLELLERSQRAASPESAAFH